MAYVDKKVAELREKGVFSAERVDSNVIGKIINMEEFEYYGMEIVTLESYLGILAQQALYVQQEVNIAEAREIELSNSFKVEALPMVMDSKIRSVEERWIFASTLNDKLKLKFDLWQQAIIEATLKKKLADPIVEKLNVLKKIYDDRRLEGRNKNLHKYTDGS
jgi:hypothetical protein